MLLVPLAVEVMRAETAFVADILKQRDVAERENRDVETLYGVVLVPNELRSNQRLRRCNHPESRHVSPPLPSCRLA